MVDPTECLFIVNYPPARMLADELADWLVGMGVWRRTFRITANQRTHSAQYNTTVAFALAHDDWEHVVFADHDIRPHADRMAKFWSIEADVVGANYPVAGEHAWDRPDAIHTGLWRTRRNVLEATGPVWFAEEYNAERTQLTACCCHHFCDKIRAAGYRIARGGYAMHEIGIAP